MNEIETRNPFASSPVVARPAAAPPAMVAVEQQRVMAEVQAQMLMARANPRDPIAAMDRILNACARPTLADVAVYTYARGGSDISGPSIRLAEVLAQNWGNIKVSVRELEQREGVSTVQAIAWDLESGYSSDKVFQVPHTRHTRNGSKRLEDPRDIYELVANQGARRLRACILAVIPGDVTEAAVLQCETTMRTKADTSPEAMQKMVAAFETFGVTRAQIEVRIQRRLDAIQPAQVVSLKKIYASLRDGMSTAGEWFDIEKPADPKSTVSLAELAKKGAKKTAGAEADPETGEVAPASNEKEKPEVAEATKPVMKYATVLDAMLKAKTVDALDEAALAIAFVPVEAQRLELRQKFDALRAEIGGAAD